MNQNHGRQDAGHLWGTVNFPVNYRGNDLLSEGAPLTELAQGG